MLAITILGNNSALSIQNRHQTAQIITHDEHQFLVADIQQKIEAGIALVRKPKR
jgi:hypothetical protein